MKCVCEVLIESNHVGSQIVHKVLTKLLEDVSLLLGSVRILLRLLSPTKSKISPTGLTGQFTLIDNATYFQKRKTYFQKGNNSGSNDLRLSSSSLLEEHFPAFTLSMLISWSEVDGRRQEWTDEVKWADDFVSHVPFYDDSPGLRTCPFLIVSKSGIRYLLIYCSIKQTIIWWEIKYWMRTGLGLVSINWSRNYPTPNGCFFLSQRSF